MGFMKAIETETGAVGEYHNVCRLSADYRRRSLMFSVATYVDKIARQEGKTPMRVKEYAMTGEGFPAMTTDAREYAYEHVKATDGEFAEAQDD